MFIKRDPYNETVVIFSELFVVHSPVFYFTLYHIFVIFV